jgi:hypothetical protein
MSALGQKQTFAVQKVMSALPPIATSIAFFGIQLWANTGYRKKIMRRLGSQGKIRRVGKSPFWRTLS